MEKPDKFSIVLYGTTINVSTKFLSNLVNIDLFVAGCHDQCLLKNSDTMNDKPGTILYQDHIYWKNKDNKSYYHDDTWEFFGHENRIKEAQKNVISQSAIVMVITEPHITLKGYYHDPFNTLVPIPRYQVPRFDTHQNLWEPRTFDENEAITQASKDLTLCYEKVLEQGVCVESKSIALPTLGADVGFPRDKAAPIALTAITNFLMHHPGAYHRIKLWVKKRSEFVAYTTFLTHYWQKPCLLYCAHKDENCVLRDIPRDVIGYILQLMHLYEY